MVRRLKMEVHSYKEDNERLMREKIQVKSRLLQRLNQLQRQTENGSNLREQEEGRFHERRNHRVRVGYSKSASRAHGHNSPPYPEIRFCASKDPVSSPEVSPVRHQRRKPEIYSLQGEVRKLKLPSFDSER
jgi:hypothetical protein